MDFVKEIEAATGRKLTSIDIGGGLSRHVWTGTIKSCWTCFLLTEIVCLNTLAPQNLDLQFSQFSTSFQLKRFKEFPESNYPEQIGKIRSFILIWLFYVINSSFQRDSTGLKLLPQPWPLWSSQSEIRACQWGNPLYTLSLNKLQSFWIPTSFV